MTSINFYVQNKKKEFLIALTWADSEFAKHFWGITSIIVIRPIASDC